MPAEHPVHARQLGGVLADAGPEPRLLAGLDAAEDGVERDGPGGRRAEPGERVDGEQGRHGCGFLPGREGGLYPSRRQRAKGPNSPSAGQARYTPRLTPTPRTRPCRTAPAAPCSCSRPGPATAGEKSPPRSTAKPITVAELDAAVGQLPRRRPRSPEAQKQQQRADVLQQLIDDRLVRQFLAERAEGRPAEVDRQFAALERASRLGEDGRRLFEGERADRGARKENFLRMLQLARFVEARATEATCVLLRGEPRFLRQDDGATATSSCESRPRLPGRAAEGDR